ncbi:MAG: 5-formyltetrahydrofolate cyclo-ligase [Candidatus Nanopelagicales bacterium]
MPSKAELRSKLLIERRARSDRHMVAEQIAEFAASLINDHETDIGLYSSTEIEPPTSELIKILEKDKNLYFPKVINNDLAWIKNPKEFEKGSFNILEPVGMGALISEFPEITSLFIPAFAVSPRGMRLGKGGGFYDRLLAKLDLRLKKIAIVFDSEVIDDLPSESHDEKVDFIVTEKRILTINQSAD